MKKTVDRFLRGIGVLGLSLVGMMLLAAVVALRHIMETPQPLESPLPGEAHIYRWKRGHIFYKALGPEEAPPLVLLHAPDIGASSYEMRHLMEPLAKQFRVYAPDLPGFGLSDRPGMDYSAETYITLIQDFLRDVVGQPAMLVANGLSNNYAVACSAAQPRTVRAPGAYLALHALPFGAGTGISARTHAGTVYRHAPVSSSQYPSRAPLSSSASAFRVRHRLPVCGQPPVWRGTCTTGADGWKAEPRCLSTVRAPATARLDDLGAASPEQPAGTDRTARSTCSRTHGTGQGRRRGSTRRAPGKRHQEYPGVERWRKGDGETGASNRGTNGETGASNTS